MKDVVHYAEVNEDNQVVCSVCSKTIPPELLQAGGIVLEIAGQFIPGTPEDAKRAINCDKAKAQEIVSIELLDMPEDIVTVKPPATTDVEKMVARGFLNNFFMMREMTKLDEE